MHGALDVLALVTALGCGLSAGVFFAFSAFVMDGLARAERARGHRGDAVDQPPRADARVPARVARDRRCCAVVARRVDRACRAATGGRASRPPPRRSTPAGASGSPSRATSDERRARRGWTHATAETAALLAGLRAPLDGWNHVRAAVASTRRGGAPDGRAHRGLSDVGARPLVTRRTFARLARHARAHPPPGGARRRFALGLLGSARTLRQLHPQALAGAVAHDGPRRHRDRDHGAQRRDLRGRARRRPRDRDRRVPGHDRARLGARRLARRSSSASWPPTSSSCCSPIWLGEKSSVCTQVIERLYGNSHLLNADGPVRLLRPRRRVPDHGQRGRRQALRDEHPVLAPAPRLRDPAAGRRRVDGRGRPGPELPRPRLGRAGERLHEPQHVVHGVEPACTSRGR